MLTHFISPLLQNAKEREQSLTVPACPWCRLSTGSHFKWELSISGSLQIYLSFTNLYLSFTKLSIFLYKSLTEAKQVIPVRSICFCWPFVQWGTTAHIHRTEKELKRRTLFLFLTELPQAVTQPQHTLRTSPEGKNYVEQIKCCINSCHIL